MVSSQSVHVETGIYRINMVSLYSQSSSSYLNKRTRGQIKNNFEGEFPKRIFQSLNLTHQHGVTLFSVFKQYIEKEN